MSTNGTHNTADRSLSEMLAAAGLPNQAVATVPDAVAEYKPKNGVDHIVRASEVIARATIASCESTAAVIEDDAQALLNHAQRFHDDSMATARSIREIGHLEAGRNTAFLEKVAEARRLQDSILALFKKVDTGAA